MSFNLLGKYISSNNFRYILIRSLYVISLILFNVAYWIEKWSFADEESFTLSEFCYGHGDAQFCQKFDDWDQEEPKWISHMNHILIDALVFITITGILLIINDAVKWKRCADADNEHIQFVGYIAAIGICVTCFVSALCIITAVGLFNQNFKSTPGLEKHSQHASFYLLIFCFLLKAVLLGVFIFEEIASAKASRRALCGVCGLIKITKSDVWCLECEIGLCLECKEHHGLSMERGNHNTVLISKYESLPTNVLEIRQFCSEHQENFQLYCENHEQLCCSSCFVSDHQKCKDLIQLNDMIRTVKKSYGFIRMEDAMIDMIDIIMRIKNDREANLCKLIKERTMIEKEIEQKRIEINDKLDNFQKAIKKELYEAESKERNTIIQLLKSIEKNEKEIQKYQEDLINIKQNASDLQAFMAMKRLEPDLAKKDEYFTSLGNSNLLNRVNLSCHMSEVLQESFNKILKFGDIIVSTHFSEVEIVRKKETQAQAVVAHVRSTPIDNLLFESECTVDTKLKEIRGCTLLPDGRMVFSCYKEHRVTGFNTDGSTDFDIRLNQEYAFDITYVHHNNTIAVTSGGGTNRCISILDVERKEVKNTLAVESRNYGIIRRNNTLIYCAKDCGLQMIDLADKSVSNIVRSKMRVCEYVTTFGDKLYYTDKDRDTVICYYLGTVQWTFTNASVLTFPQGISVDNDGNVYVVGYKSRNIVILSPDGKRHRELFSGKVGLGQPTLLYYERTTEQLLVANKAGKAFLFKRMIAK